jgi:hypothetical protein
LKAQESAFVLSFSTRWKMLRNERKQINLISLSLNKTGNGLVYSPTLASTIYKGDILFFTYTFKKRNYFHARNN